MKDTVETSMTTSALLRTPYLAEVGWVVGNEITSHVFYRSSSNFYYCPAATVVKLLYHNTPGAVNAKKFAAWRDCGFFVARQPPSTPTAHQSFEHSTPNEPSLQDQLSIKEEINNYVGQRTDAVSECETNAPEERRTTAYKINSVLD
jgi:hypothetical protein